MNILYRHLYEVFKEELIRLNIGYMFDKSTLLYMNELINAIDYLKEGNPSIDEALTIIRRYER